MFNQIKFLFTFLILFCSILGISNDTYAKDKKSLDKNRDEISSDDRHELNYGYAIMYEHIKDIGGSNVLMDVKKNSEALTKLTDEIVNTLNKNKKTLDELKKQYPAIDFENRGQPEVFEQTTKSIKWHKAFAFAPLIGKTGNDFERDFVIDTKYGIDQIARISHILSEREKNPGLKTPLREISDENSKLLNDIEYLLNEKYYKVSLNKKK